MSKRTYLEVIHSFNEKEMAQFIGKIYMCGQQGALPACGKCGLFLCCPPEVIEENLKMDECFDLLKGGTERA